MNAVVPREKLAAVLGMLGSTHDGEALNAARLADRMRRAAGVTWTDLLSGPAVCTYPPPRRPHWRDLIAECRHRPGLLTAWEQRFLASIMRRSHLSQKQLTVLEAIAAKTRDH
jgi:hypothetical protein